MREPERFGRAVRPIVFAHRGAAAELPENTLPSFARALELGADALEMDLHMTLDGVIVVAHDPDGARTTGVPAPIRTARHAELAHWDAGFGFVNAAGQRPFVGKGYRIPSFEEVLEAFPGVLLNVDAKQPAPSLVRALIDLLEKQDATARVTIASFSRTTVREVRRLGFRGHTGLAPAEVASLVALPERVLRELRTLGRIGDAAQVPLKKPLTTRWFVEKCRRLGITSDYWTVNDAPTARALVALGVDGIMTDDPGAIVPVVRAARAGGDQSGRGG